MAARTRPEMRAEVYDNALYHEDVALTGAQADAVVDFILTYSDCADLLATDDGIPTAGDVYTAMLELGIIEEADAR